MFHSMFSPLDDDFRERMFDLAGRPPTDICPFCGFIYEDGEYEDYGGMSQKISPARCTNDECQAYELGGWKMAPTTQVYHVGWVRDKRPGDEDKYPAPPKYALGDRKDEEDNLEFFKNLAVAENVAQPTKQREVERG